MKTKSGGKSALLSRTVRMLLDPKMDPDDRKMLLIQVCHDDSPDSSRALQELLSLASEDMARKAAFLKQRQLDETLEMLKDGPLRLGTYVQPAPTTDEGSLVQRAQVLLENGDTALSVFTDPDLADSLRCGDPVLLDAQARAVIEQGPSDCVTGEVGQLQRRIGADRVRVSLNDLSSQAYRLSDLLQQQIDLGEVPLGTELLVCTRRRMAFEALPREDGLADYMFLERGPLPEVDVQRDIGSPHPYIEELIEHVRDELTNPGLGRKYGVRAMQTRLLKGLTGTGKTLSILAVIRSIYGVMSEITGAPIEALPRRVMRMRMSQVLNKYLGESDKRLDRFFDEVTQLANEPFVWEGREWKLPVIARCEEIDSLAQGTQRLRRCHGADPNVRIGAARPSGR